MFYNARIAISLLFAVVCVMTGECTMSLIPDFNTMESGFVFDSMPTVEASGRGWSIDYDVTVYETGKSAYDTVSTSSILRKHYHEDIFLLQNRLLMWRHLTFKMTAWQTVTQRPKMASCKETRCTAAGVHVALFPRFRARTI